MAGDQTKAMIALQPEWLRQVPTGPRLWGRALFTGCGTSFHAAQPGGEAVRALELARQPDREAELLVLVSHEAETRLTLQAAQAWQGPKWIVTRRGDGARAEVLSELI